MMSQLTMVLNLCMLVMINMLHVVLGGVVGDECMATQAWHARCGTRRPTAAAVWGV